MTSRKPGVADQQLSLTQPHFPPHHVGRAGRASCGGEACRAGEWQRGLSLAPSSDFARFRPMAPAVSSAMLGSARCGSINSTISVVEHRAGWAIGRRAEPRRLRISALNTRHSAHTGFALGKMSRGALLRRMNRCVYCVFVAWARFRHSPRVISPFATMG
jgi:hypothetical protein